MAPPICQGFYTSPLPFLFGLANLWPTIFLAWPTLGQLPFCLGQPLANYLFVLANPWPTIFLPWPTLGQEFCIGNLLRNNANDCMQ